MAIFHDPKKKAVLVAFAGTPVSADAIKLCDYVQFAPEIDAETKYCLGDGKGEVAETVVQPRAKIKASITTMARVTPAPGTPPTIDNLFKMCGLLSTVDGTANTVTYTKNPEMNGTGTIIDYDDGEKRVIDGVFADLSMEFIKGEVVKLTFDVNGETDVKPTIEANPTDIILDTGTQFYVDCISVFGFDGGTLHFKSAVFKLGNNITDSNLLKNAEDGTNECEIYKVDTRRPTLELKDNKEKGNLNYWNDLLDGTKRAFSIEMTNVSTGQKLKLDLPSISYSMVKENSQESRVETDRTFDVGDDYSLTYS